MREMTQLLFRAQKDTCIELPDLESQDPAGPGIVLYSLVT